MDVKINVISEFNHWGLRKLIKDSNTLSIYHSNQVVGRVTIYNKYNYRVLSGVTVGWTGLMLDMSIDYLHEDYLNMELQFDFDVLYDEVLVLVISDKMLLPPIEFERFP